ncbi:MAG: FemAB family XrtA/PEP-CTERM system-associated protein [Planctomycetota bacterium]
MDATNQSQPFVLHARVVTGTGGGPEKTILNSPRFLRSQGYESACAYLHPPGDAGFDLLKERAAECDAELISVPDRGLTDLSIVRRVLTICRDRNVTIWHGHDYKSDALGLLLSRFRPMKLVSTVHGWGVRSKKTPLYYAVDRAALRRYDRVVCVSDELLQQCIAGGIPIGRCSEIANGIDIAACQTLPNRRAARAEFGIRNDHPVVIAVGRLSEEKGFDVLIKAVDYLIESDMPVNLAIAGQGPEHDVLQQLITQAGRGKYIRLLGHVADPRRLFAAADAFVLSSRSEGLPNVLLEALACGVPVITTSVGAVPNVVTHGEDALFVPVADVEALAVTLTRLLSNPSLQDSLANNGRLTVERNFSFEARMQKMAALYDSLLGRDAASTHRRGARPEERAWSENNASADSPRPSRTHGVPPSTEHSGEVRHEQDIATATLTRPQVEKAAPLTVPAQQKPQVELTSSPETWTDFLAARGHTAFYQQAEWSRILSRGLQHEPVCLQATSGPNLVGVLPLMFVRSRLFGRFLVSQPYLNSAGIVADSPEVATALVDKAVELADQLDVRYLELRHEKVIDHPALTEAITDKVHMRLALPQTTDELWKSFKSKLRSQIRKPLSNEALSAVWGGHDLLDEFYDVFTQNMRDLGTPPFSRDLFLAMLDELPGDAELCTIRFDDKPIAAGLLIHGPGVTEVPSASSLRAFNSTAANMLLYWHLLSRAVERGQHTFDFGRSSKDAGTYRFKAQWGAKESPAVWQHYVRNGSASDMRPNSGKYDLMINIWQKLPVWLTKIIGPSIVRGIP